METEKEWREKEGSKISKHKTETELHTLLSFGRGAVISMEKELFNPDVFNEVKYGEKEGIGRLLSDIQGRQLCRGSIH